MKNISDVQDDLSKPPRTGEIVKGKIIGVGRSSVFIDLGALGTGIIYGKEFHESKSSLKETKIGDEITTMITDLENEDGYIELSLKQAGQELTWDMLREKKDTDEPITVKILSANRGGLLAEISGVPAFLPVSQLSSEHYPRVEDGDRSKILDGLQKLVGQKLEVKIFDLEPDTEKLILSEKAEETGKIKEALKGCKKGDIVEGEITGLADFGAFMKFSLPPSDTVLEGLIHISELDWQLIEHPSEIVKVGQKIKVKIIETTDDRVSLSLKALKEDPWLDIKKKYKKGDIVKGTIVRLSPFGAFAKISSTIQGLVHISEFNSRKEMEETLKKGEKHNFQILTIDPQEHRMSFKLVK